MSFRPTTTTTSPENLNLWITHVSALGPYLKISGQLNPMTDLSQQLETNLLPLCEPIKHSWSMDQKKKKLQLDDVYLVKSSNRASSLGDTEYLRTRIVRLIETPTPPKVLFVEVEFIDMGYKKIIPCEELLIAPKGNKLLTMSALSTQYIMLGIFGNFTPEELENVLRLIARQNLMITIEMEIQGHKFIKMKWKDWDFAEFLVSQRQIGAPIEKVFQLDDFLRLLEEQAQEIQLDTVNASLNENNNSYKKNNNNLNHLTNGISGGAIGVNNIKPNTHNNPANMHGLGPVYGTGRLNEKAILLKRQLLERERQLERQLEQERYLLLQRQLMQQQIMQRVMPPQFNLPPNVRNRFPNYMLGALQQQNRFPTPAVYGTMLPPVLPSLRMQRPLVLPRAEPKILNANNNNNNIQSASNGKLTTAAAAAPTSSTGKIYKINKFVVGSSYEVCVSFVENGPYNFSVQHSAAQAQLTAMMNQIERIELKNLNFDPKVGMACIARYSEDGHMYRAVINSAQPNGIKVIYIDYGNSEYVKKSDLYEIPQEFLAEPAFALPVSLAGLKALGPIDNSLKKTFKEMVVYQMCKLKITPPEGPPVVQYCELYLQNKNMLEVLQEIQKSRLVYPKAVQLSSNDAVEIRFIDSPRNFYVQKASNIDEFDKLMDEMDKYYNAKQVVPQHVAVGAAYAVKNDYEWYRAEVIRADELAIIVRFIDFGYERVVTKNLLSNIAEQHLKMPRQAVHCCLKGFETNELSNKDIATTQFEMLAEESTGTRRLFTVKVFRIHPDDVHIVNLFTKELNVMKKLYKLSMPFEQYLSLEKEDFNLNSGNSGNQTSKMKQRDQNTKTYSINSSNENSSQMGKNSIKSNDVTMKTPVTRINLMKPMTQQQPQQKQTLMPQQQQQIQQSQQQQQMQQIVSKHPQMLNHSTPAQRLQQYNNKNKSPPGGISDWDNNSSASSNMSKHKHQRGGNNSSQQQQQQRKSQRQDMLNSSFESTDRRSDASTTSNRSRNTNAGRQKERNNNKEADYTRTPTGRTKRSQQQQQQRPNQQQQHQNPHERSQNAPQGYSQSRRGSTDSQYSVVISNDLQQLHSKAIATAAAAVLNARKNEEYVSLDYAFPIEAIKTPTTEDVTICWWISPHQFYTHRKIRAPAFEELMRELQEFYFKKPVEQLKLKPGAHVIARNRKDRTLYRARIITCNPMLRKYKVLFVDFGNQYTVSSEDIWQVERRFADFPIMAYCCSFKNIVLNFDHLYIIDRMEKYLPNGTILSCEYKEANEQNVYYVNIKVNNASLLDRLKNDKIVTEISPDQRLELLAGQQIRAKIISVKNMLNFKMIFEGCDVPLLCSHDDVRFVKSNPDIGQRFKQFYEGKSCIVNIKSVNDNKVILLRPLLPLFLDDIPNFICCKPRISQKFEGRLVFIASPSRLYVHDSDAEVKVANLLDDMYQYYENQGTVLKSFGIDQICAAKSAADTNWYRARIIHPKINIASAVEVYYIDYGNTEILEKTQLKVLEPQFYVEQNALAIEINLPIVMWPANDKKAKTEDMNAAAIEQLRLMSEEQLLIVKALECRRNHLIAEVSLKETGQNVVDQLLTKKCVKARDLDFMCKQLEKDKSSLLEFIETVDLTLEDEDAPSRVSTPRKKKTQTAAESPKKVEPEKEKLPVTSSPIKSTTKEVEKIEIVEKEQPPSVVVDLTTPKPALPTNAAIAEVSSSTLVANEESSSTESNAAPTVEPIIPKVEPSDEMSVSTEFNTSNSPAPSIASSSHLFESNNMEQAVLSHCDNPAQFFIHAYDKIEQLHKLQENLQIVASSLPPLMNVNNGANCISLYSVDKQWYRAEIIDAELMVLKFIDFGNTDCVTDTTDIKEMSVFPDIEPLCIPCALPIRPNKTADWVDAANTIFNESYEKILYFTYITHSDPTKPKKPSYIQLYIDGVNIAKRLIDDGFAQPLELVETGENCYISHVNSLSDFYIQYEKDSKGLELIELCLESYEKLPLLKQYVEHKIVAALFHDDEKWYRAKLLREFSSNNDAEGGVSYEVLFIDYGNTAVSRECREIPAEIAKLPALSKKCALDLDLEVYFGWSEAAEAKFAEISSCGDTIFNVELRAPAPEYALVHLYIDTLNLNCELEQLCLRRTPGPTDKSIELMLNASLGAHSVATIDPNDTTQLHTGVIAQLDGPESFYVQFEKDSARLEDFTTTLNAIVGMDILSSTTAAAKVGKLYAAVFDDDQQLYRARLLNVNEEENEENKYEVIFVDFGNKAFVKELRILPTDLENIRSIAKHCTLNKLEELQQLGDGAIEHFKEEVNSADGVIKLEFAATTHTQPDDGPFKVNLYTLNTNEDILEKIKALINPMQEIEFDDYDLPLSAQDCLIPHYVSPREFYIQLPNQIAKLNAITQALTKENVMAKMPKVAMVPVLNQIYAVFAEDDDLYYRGLVMAKSEQDNKCYQVLLIDYGNKINVTEIRELPAELKNAPAMAKLCQLADIISNNNNNETLLNEHFQTLMEAHFGETFEIEQDLSSSSSNANAKANTKTTPMIVKLKIKGEDVACKLSEALKTGGKALVEDASPTLNDCAIIQVNSPSSFYIQLLEDTTEIEALTEALLDAETEFEQFDDELQVGAICAARFPDDGNFYRSCILEVIEAEVEKDKQVENESAKELEDEESKNEKKDKPQKSCLVHFIDFGNNSITTDFRKLPENLAKQRRFSKHCSLDIKFKHIEAATHHLQTYINEHYSETFQVELMIKDNVEKNIEGDELWKTTPTPIPCRLFNQTKNVASEIEKKLKEDEAAADE